MNIVLQVLQDVVDCQCHIPRLNLNYMIYERT